MSSSALANDARARLGVLTHRRSLDRRLAEGQRADRDPALSLRARQLTSGRSRRSLAGSLKRTVQLAREPRRFGPAVPVDRRAVLEARLQILEIASRLEDGAPTNPRGVAIVHELLTDGSSPLYASSLTRSDSSNGQLHNRLDQATSALGANA